MSDISRSQAIDEYIKSEKNNKGENTKEKLSDADLIKLKERLQLKKDVRILKKEVISNSLLMVSLKIIFIISLIFLGIIFAEGGRNDFRAITGGLISASSILGLIWMGRR
ncbi:hypothetical protein PE074_06500 [Wohlfahrtiimonas chitiniclastica]|uniref:hypothetical protein n=1 Tax=Wohlfahrtiimonas chitiniclastica TaxID=400946 RepID=UPI0007B3FDB1|nr:hypothetical protein [Wohlfahrtiimonas chitiniclastica]MBS7814770.1 hypothetical protein [Wohlfahrtiimonas chitiniclastica]WHR54745.1 hypothetical protein PE074_06500 [Wohlfahrtiimonas chitiniclastica]